MARWVYEAPRLPSRFWGRRLASLETVGARWLSGDGAFIQGYNGQAAVDASSQVIVAARLTNSAADCPQLLEVVAEIEANLGELPRELSADAGYCSEANLEALDELGVTAYVATGRMPRSYRCPPSPCGRIPAGLTRRERMKRRLMTKRGRERYRLRALPLECHEEGPPVRT
jgi:hypothetical protein